VFLRGRFSTKFWFNRTSKFGVVEGVRLVLTSKIGDVEGVSVYPVHIRTRLGTAKASQFLEI
jgi:hypothetical protein